MERIDYYKTVIDKFKIDRSLEGASFEGPIRVTLKKMSKILRKSNLLDILTNSLSVKDDFRINSLMIRLQCLKIVTDEFK